VTVECIDAKKDAGPPTEAAAPVAADDEDVRSRGLDSGCFTWPVGESAEEVIGVRATSFVAGERPPDAAALLDRLRASSAIRALISFLLKSPGTLEPAPHWHPAPPRDFVT